MFGLGAGLVAVVVAIVVIAAILTSSGGELHEIWSVQKPVRRGEATTVMAYPTTDGKTFVRVSLYGAVGHDITTGKVEWRVTVPKGVAVCASTHGAPGDIGALVYGGKKGCSTVVAFDVRTGSRLWSTTLAVRESTKAGSAALAVAGDRIYVSNTQRIVGYDARTGPKGTGAAAPVEVRPSGADCLLRGAASTTERLVTIEACDGARRTLVGLDPGTLHVAFRTPLRLEHDQEVHVMSVSPLVLHATNALDNGELHLFDDAGRATKVFSSRQHQGVLALESTPGAGYHDDNVGFPVRVVGDTLVAQLADDDFDTDDESRVAGVDVRRGRWSWTSSLDTQNDVDLVTGGDPRKVTVFAEGGYSFHLFGGDERPHLLEVDPASGEVTEGDELDTGDDTPDFYTASVFAVGREVVVTQVLTSHDGPIVTTYGP